MTVEEEKGEKEMTPVQVAVEGAHDAHSTTEAGPAPTGKPFSITPIRFFNLIQDKDKAALKSYKGLQGVMATLQTDAEKGISSASVAERQRVYGVNVLPVEDEVSYCKFLLEALSDKMMILLLVLGCVALIINLSTPEHGEDEVDYSKAWIDGTFIIVAVTIVILVTTVNDYMKALKFQALSELTNKADIYVIRDSKRQKVDVAEVVVGDIVEFSGGAYVPADGLYLQGQGVSIDEAAATGENDDKKKDAVKDPFLISGTNVLAGVDAKFVAIGVGENSFSGRLEMAAREKGKRTATPLQEKLDALADLVGRVGIAVALLLFVTLTAITSIRAGANGDSYDFKLLLDFAIIGVSIIVVAVPEGLPLSVVIALAYSMQAMMKDNNMVRSLAACETMGAATSICSDKTGTLTTNEMTVMKANVGGLVTKAYDHNGTAAVTVADMHDDLSSKALSIYTEALIFNSTAEKIPAPAGTKTKIIDGKIWIGNKTEQGLNRWADRADSRGMSLRTDVPRENRLVYPFQSSKKSMTTLVRYDQQHYGKCIMQYTKGAPEIVLEHCVNYMNADGEEVPLEDAKREEFMQGINGFGSEGLRCIGVAFRRFGGHDEEFPEEDPLKKDLTFAGFNGIEDPVRDEVPPAVLSCQEAGVTVRMCTGDNAQTAKAIGTKCGIFTEGGVVMEGPVFRRLFCDNEEEFMKILPNIQILARCSPLDKQLFVGNLMLLGEVVAVTGDGTNDAPALKLADVGFAMNDGTDVAKKASKIVLLDNNFASVVKAVKWGRNVNDNIRKFLQFQFTVNVVLLIITYIGAVKNASESDGNGDPPLAAIHLLWANLIMDTMAALALSTESPNEDLLKKPPTYRDSPLINRKMWRFIFGGAAWQLCIMLTLIFAGEDLPIFETTSWTDHVPSLIGATPESIEDFKEDETITLRTTLFNVFIFLQIFNWFHARKLYDEMNPFEGFSRSPFFLPIVAFTSGFQVLMVEAAQEFMETRNQSWQRWVVALVIAFTMWPMGSLLRLIPVEEKEHVQKRLDDGIDVDEDDSDDDEYGAHAKLKLVMDVRKQQRELIKEGEAPPPQPTRLREVLQSLKARVRVIRALRGPRGDPLARRKSSGVSATSHQSKNSENEPAHVDEKKQ